MKEFGLIVQGVVAALYVVAAVLLLLRARPGGHLLAVRLALAGCVAHAGLMAYRWWVIGQIPIVTRYEDLTVDALTMVAVYLVAQWRLPQLRRAGTVALGLSAGLLVWALSYSRVAVPFDPSLRTNWLIIHAQLNSFALGGGALAAGAAMLMLGEKQPSNEMSAITGRMTAWAFFLWAAMVAAGSYWASLAWGRYWGWDPIENWSFATITSYAFVLHLHVKAKWRGRAWAAVALLPFAISLFTTYGLLMVMSSLHSQYVFQ